LSGQNVGFLLVAFGPLLRRLRWGARLPVTTVVLLAFALVVRFEPSVLRAVGMAAIATVAAATGRPAAGGRILSLAVTGLVLVDPLLVRSVGFLLSVAASAAILGLAPRIRVAIGGPAWLAEPLAVTVAAQAGTAPVLLATFGPLPVASIPANLFAVPVAGALMVWGLGAGVVAGLGPPWLAVAIHLPTRALTWWLAEVADRAAGLPLGTIDAPRALVLVAVVAAGRSVRRLGPDRGAIHGRRPVVVGLCAAVLLSASLARPVPGPGPTPVAEAGTLWSTGGQRLLVLDGGGGARRGLEALRLAGARCVDVLAVEQASPGGVALAAALRRRCAGLVVVAEQDIARPGWVAVPTGTDLRRWALARSEG
jgi:competence protein ComEC